MIDPLTMMKWKWAIMKYVSSRAVDAEARQEEPVNPPS
jgi:hypothetical protein